MIWELKIHLFNQKLHRKWVESHKHHVDLHVNLPTKKRVKCSVMHKNCPITLNQVGFEGDLIQLDLSKFDIILGMD